MVVSGAYITLRDMLFQSNTVYGQNTSSGAGGSGAGAGLAINWSQAGTSSLLERVTFDSNQSFGGTGPVRGGLAFGAFYMNGSVTVRDSTFTNNTARAGNSTGNGSSGGLLADALGGAIGGGGGNWVLENVTATNNLVQGGNAASSAGGGYGGAIIIENGSNFALRDSYFSNNIAQGGIAAEGGFGAGGGVLVNNTPATIERVEIINNSAIGGSATGSGKAGAGGGGGLYLWRNSASASASVSVINTIIAANYVALGSSGNTSAGGGGGGIQVQGLYANIKHTTIAFNRLGPNLVSGQGLLLLAAPGVGSASADVSNSIIANHTEGASGASAVLVQSGNSLKSLHRFVCRQHQEYQRQWLASAFRHNQRSEYHDPGCLQLALHHPMRRIGITTLPLALRQSIAPKISASAWISTARRAPSTSSRISAPTNIPVWRLRTSSIDYPSSSANRISAPLARQLGSVGIAVEISGFGGMLHPIRVIPMSRQFSRPWRI